MPAIMLILVFGLALIAGPIAANVTGHGLGTAATLILVGSGLVVSIFAMVLIVINKFYKKTVASEALVRTGVGGIAVVLDGGITCIPGFHQLGVVSLRTVRLPVPRQANDSLLTKDKLRADIIAEFFVRVQPTKEAIQTAARSFGSEGVSEQTVKTLVEDKLVSALRSAASTMTLEELNSNRDGFLKTVTESVREALDHNGLILETATISKLDQTDPKNLNEHNVFDAQGMRTSAEIVQVNLTERNRLEREGELARTQRDVDTRQKVLASQQTQAQAEAEQAARIAEIQAQQSRLAQEQQIMAQRSVELATVEKARALAVAEREMQQATEVAERQKLEAVTQADQKVEVAKRAADEAIAKAEAKKAAAEAERAKAQALLETEKQAITTVDVVATAERAKQQQVIAAQADADRALITAKNTAEAEAYAIERNAEARKKAADADAEATRKAAEAQRDAKKAQAEGEQAIAMIPAQVKKEMAAADDAQANVDLKRLQGQDQYGRTGLEFQVRMKAVEVEGQVRIETAKALATTVGQIDAKVVGTPDQVNQLVQGLANGMGLARKVNGFLEELSPEATDLLGAAGSQIVSALGALAKKAGLTPQEIAAGGKFMDASKSKGGKPDSEGDAGNGT